MVKKDKLNETQWKKLTESGGQLSDDKKTWYPSEQSFKGSQTKDAGILKDGKTIHDFDDIKNFLRPNLLVLTSCKKVLLEGVTFQNSPAWCLHPLMCEDLTIRNVYAKNPGMPRTAMASTWNPAKTYCWKTVRSMWATMESASSRAVMRKAQTQYAN